MNKDLPELEGMFGYVPIKEIAPFYYVYVACPKNEWGKTLVTKINESLKKLRPSDPFRREMGQMYGGEQLKTVMKFYDSQLLKINE